MLDFSFADAPDAPLVVTINGQVLEHSLQLPAAALSETTRIDVRGRRLSEAGPLWVESTVRLDAVHAGEDRIRYEATAFGQVEIILRNTSAARIFRADGGELPVKSEQENESLLLEAKVFGAIVIECVAS